MITDCEYLVTCIRRNVNVGSTTEELPLWLYTVRINSKKPMISGRFKNNYFLLSFFLYIESLLKLLLVIDKYINPNYYRNISKTDLM